MDGIIRVLGRVVKVIAGLAGSGDVLITALREAAIAVLRVVAIFVPRVEKKLIPVVERIFDGIKKVWDNVKRFLLDMDPNPVGK